FDILRYLHQAGIEVHVAWLAPHSHLRRLGVWTLPADFSQAVTLHTPDGYRLGRRQLFPAVYWQPRNARLLHSTKPALARVGITVSRRHDRPAAARLPRRAWMALPNEEELAFVSRVVERIQPDSVLANYAW